MRKRQKQARKMQRAEKRLKKDRAFPFSMRCIRSRWQQFGCQAGRFAKKAAREQKILEQSALDFREAFAWLERYVQHVRTSVHSYAPLLCCSGMASRWTEIRSTSLMQSFRVSLSLQRAFCCSLSCWHHRKFSNCQQCQGWFLEVAQSDCVAALFMKPPLGRWRKDPSTQLCLCVDNGKPLYL